MLLAPQPLMLLVAGKVFAHWLTTGVPLVLAAPLFGVLFDMSGPGIAALAFGLLIGTPVLSLLGAVGAALTLGLRSGGALVFLLVLPLTIPTLIFGAGAVGAVEGGLSPRAHFSLMGALLIVTALGAPLATAAALRISLD
jgi:heme exporter protein B